jgi:hypothetical protein
MREERWGIQRVGGYRELGELGMERAPRTICNNRPPCSSDVQIPQNERFICRYVSQLSEAPLFDSTSVGA